MDEFQIAHFPHVFTAKMARLTLQCHVFLTFSYPSHLKHLVLRAFLEDCLPEMLSKLSVLAERGIKMSKKHHAIAPAALGGCGGLGQLWEALAELWDPTLDPTLDPIFDPYSVHAVQCTHCTVCTLYSVLTVQ